MKLLHVDSSILGAGSVSRALSAEIVATQRRLHPGLEATYRDLAAEPPLHLSPAHIAAWQTKAMPEEEGVRRDLADGEAMIAELFAAGLAVLAGAYYWTDVSRVLLFWAAFILTRPLGATVGDFLDKPRNHGGLALSRPIASAVIAVLILAAILLLPQRAGTHPSKA